MLQKNSITEILRDKTLRDKIAQNKKKLMPMKESNYNSVVMYHAPTDNGRMMNSNIFCDKELLKIVKDNKKEE